MLLHDNMIIQKIDREEISLSDKHETNQLTQFYITFCRNHQIVLNFIVEIKGTGTIPCRHVVIRIMFTSIRIKHNHDCLVITYLLFKFILTFYDLSNFLSLQCNNSDVS